MFNFIKKNVFTQGNNFAEDYEEDIKGGVLAVWGAPSCGKTLIATKIAHYLASKRKNVILLLCDTTTPMLPCILPPSEIEHKGSLGKTLEVTVVTKSLVAHNLTTLKRNSHLSILGMKKGENEYTYAPYTKEQAEELIDCLKEIAPYIVIDCGSFIANDVLSAVALKAADDVLRLIYCDLKSISYLSSQLPLLENNDFKPQKHYRVASNIKPNHGVEKMALTLGSVAFTIPYSTEVEEQFLQGNLLQDLQLKNSRAFQNEVGRIVREVFEI